MSQSVTAVRRSPREWARWALDQKDGVAQAATDWLIDVGERRQDVRDAILEPVLRDLFRRRCYELVLEEVRHNRTAAKVESRRRMAAEDGALAEHRQSSDPITPAMRRSAAMFVRSLLREPLACMPSVRLYDAPPDTLEIAIGRLDGQIGGLRITRRFYTKVLAAVVAADAPTVGAALNEEAVQELHDEAVREEEEGNER